jgi:branched-chain amino acid transport system permease protein
MQFFEQLLILGLLTGSVYGLIGVGFTLILGVGRIANFAHGSFVGVGLYLAWWTHDKFNLNPYVLVAPAIVAFGIVGFVVAELFEWRGKRVGQIGELLVGLALLLLISGGLEAIFASDPRILRDVNAGDLHIVGIIIHGTQIIAAAATLASAIGLYYVIRVSRWGRAMRAVANNPAAAGLYGVKVPIARRAAVILSVIIAGVSGVLISPFTVMTPGAGSTYLISAFAIVIIGGVGNTLGAVIAGLALGVIEAMASGYLDSYWTTLVPLILILAFLMLKPEIGEA